MTRVIQPGETVKLAELDPVIKNVRVAVSWQLLPDLKNPPEGDMFAFLLDKNDKTGLNEDFIFYNQPDGPDANDSARLFGDDNSATADGGRQSIVLGLDEIRYEIASIVIGLNLYRADERDQSWRYLQSVQLALTHENGKKTLASYDVDPQQHRDAVCMSLLRFERDGGKWQITALEAHSPSFDTIARQYGIVVAGGG